MGCNAIRTAHQPLSTNLMDYCAKSGMMVFDEVFDEWLGTKIGDINSYSFAGSIAATNPLLLKEDMGNTDVSAWSSAKTVTWAEFGLKSTIMRDRNNPAVIIWGLGNELFEQSGVNSDTAKQTLLLGHTKLTHKADLVPLVITVKRQTLQAVLENILTKFKHKWTLQVSTTQ